MKNWVPKRRLLITTTTITLTCLLVYFGSLIFVLNEMHQIEAAYSDPNSSFSRQQRAEILKVIVESNDKDLETLRAFYIQKGDEVEFIEEIERLGQQSGVVFEIDTINPVGKENSAFKEDIAIKINIEGSWSKIMNFLESLEKTYFGISIENINLDADVPGRWTGSVRLLVFREK